MKKLIALVLALALVMAVAVASAAKITINPNKTVDDAEQISTTYTYYKLLDASIATVSGSQVVSYYVANTTANADLITALNGVTVKVEGVDKNIFTHTTSSDGSRVNYSLNTADLGSVANSSDMAKKIATALDGIKSTNLGSAGFSYDSTTGKAVADNLTPGYYLVTSSLGTALVLDTLSDVEINTKNEYITDTKTVSKYEYQVGETVTYTITIGIPATAQVGDTVYVHDILATTYVGIHDSSNHITTTEANYDISAVDQAGNAVTLTTVAAGNANRGANDTWCKSFVIASGMTQVVITYDAEILSSAATDTGYSNKSWAHDDSFETNPSEVKVYTFDIDVDKSFAGIADANAADFKATFELQDENGTVIPLVEKTAEKSYEVADEDDSTTVSVFTVNGKDNVNIVGLGAGTYYLEEKTTKEGYNLLAKKIKVVVTDTTSGTTVSHTVKYGDPETATASLATATDHIIPITNQSGVELPSTGGIGTTIFYVLGGLLVVGAAVILVARRKAHD